ncbi:MAG TPA: hypothetical protein VEK07_18745 [Polyangiaceae bacterium]|nr:hypothetical protein [Polyangiaceae bacterium]
MAPPRFAAPSDRDAACEELANAGFVVVEIEGIGPSVGGRLGEVIDEAIERELRTRGAAGPGVADPTMTRDVAARETVLGNQLYRARSAGAAGIAVVLGPLRAAGRCGALDPSDCRALRQLANAARGLPVVLMLDSRDAQTGGYSDPVPLECILAGPGEPRSSPPVLVPGPIPCTAGSPPPRGPDDGQVRTPAASSRGGSATPTPDDPANASDLDGEWRRSALALAAAHGPQPLGALEKLFRDSYVPLAAAIASGLDDPRANCAHAEFRSAFIRSYTEAFATFAATTKRPRMVLDVPEVAAKIARLHGARCARLLLVDGMRWDLSRRVAERLSAKLGSRGVLTDELLVWSALPTKTARQLETLARGIEALRAPADLDGDAEPSRGRTSEFVRRIRVGPRELHKLDIVEARLGAVRGAVMRALPEIAEATAEILARHVDSLPPHTLLFVFGDHGFTIDRSGSAQQGGASPEEVLAGAFAVLTGDVH